MQTFLTSPNFEDTARTLDSRRLHNQINEALVILRTLTGWYEQQGRKGWPNHPATRMWRGYEATLCKYIQAMCLEWCIRTGREHDKRFDEAQQSGPIIMPPWLTGEFCAVHRSVLLAKNYDWYSQFGWGEQPAQRNDKGRWPYLWGVQ
jgi:hypothetical protein